MGFNVIIERNIVDFTTTTIYKCSNCNAEIVRTPPIGRGEVFDFNWDCIVPVCPCGEQLLVPITIFKPLIDEAKSVEV